MSLRVTRTATFRVRLGVGPGAALDITTCDEHRRPWDFSDPVMRGKAEELIDDTEPHLPVGGLMCRAFGLWQRLSRMKSEVPDKYREMRDDGVTHLKLVW